MKGSNQPAAVGLVIQKLESKQKNSLRSDLRLIFWACWFWKTWAIDMLNLEALATIPVTSHGNIFKYVWLKLTKGCISKEEKEKTSTSFLWCLGKSCKVVLS